MASLRRLNERELAELDDPELIAYARAARGTGEEEDCRLALRIFAFGMETAVRAFVRARMDSHSETAVEEVAERTLEGAVRSIESFVGTTPQEARAFVFTIAKRRIADYLRKERPRIQSLDEQSGEDGYQKVPEALRLDDEADATDTAILVDELLANLRPDHRRVVELSFFSGYSARETVERIGGRDGGADDDFMTEQNVHQITSRFRRELRARLSEAGEPQP